MTRRVLLAEKKAVAVDRIGSRCFGVFPRESLPKRINADVDEPFLGISRFIIIPPPTPPTRGLKRGQRTVKVAADGAGQNGTFRHFVATVVLRDRFTRASAINKLHVCVPLRHL